MNPSTKRYMAVLVSILTWTATGTVRAASFVDNSFNLSRYTTTSIYKSAPDSSAMYGQCSTCGDPGQGLQLQFTFPTGGVSALGFVNNTFSYDPSTQGGLASITASVDKNIITDRFGPGLGNTFRPLIEQDGTIYLAAIPGPTFTGPATTGYQTLSGTLTAASFTDYNFTTGVAGTTNPNFSGDTILFGLGQISTFPGSNSPSPTTNFEADYDNLTITTSGAPEPSTWALIIGGFGIIGFGLRRGKNKPGIDWNCACSA